MSIKEITPVQLQQWLAENPSPTLTMIDVREQHEHDIASVSHFKLLPMSQLQQHVSEIDCNQPVVVMCHHGGRSMQVAQFIAQMNPSAELYNLSGGIDAWSVTVDPQIPRY